MLVGSSPLTDRIDPQPQPQPQSRLQARGVDEGGGAVCGGARPPLPRDLGPDRRQRRGACVCRHACIGVWGWGLGVGGWWVSNLPSRRGGMDDGVVVQIHDSNRPCIFPSPITSHHMTRMQAAFSKTAEKIYENILQGVYDPNNDVRHFMSLHVCHGMDRQIYIDRRRRSHLKPNPNFNLHPAPNPQPNPDARHQGGHYGRRGRGGGGRSRGTRRGGPVGRLERRVLLGARGRGRAPDRGLDSDFAHMMGSLGWTGLDSTGVGGWVRWIRGTPAPTQLVSRNLMWVMKRRHG